MKPEFKTFLLRGGFFAVFMFFCIWFTSSDIYAAAVTAPFAGLGLAIAMRRSGKRWKRRLEAVPPVIDSDETILHSERAGHFRGFVTVGGHLYLTSRRLLFQPHAFDIQKGEFSLPLSSIAKVSSAKKTLGLLNNRLTVTDTSAAKHAFIVYYPKEWVEKLTSLPAIR